MYDISQTTLSEAIRTFQRKWEDTKSKWKDSKRNNFEQNYVAQLEQDSMNTLRQLEELSEVLRAARQRVK